MQWLERLRYKYVWAIWAKKIDFTLGSVKPAKFNTATLTPLFSLKSNEQSEMNHYSSRNGMSKNPFIPFWVICWIRQSPCAILLLFLLPFFKKCCVSCSTQHDTTNHECSCKDTCFKNQYFNWWAFKTWLPDWHLTPALLWPQLQLRELIISGSWP